MNAQGIFPKKAAFAVLVTSALLIADWCAVGILYHVHWHTAHSYRNLLAVAGTSVGLVVVAGFALLRGRQGRSARVVRVASFMNGAVLLVSGLWFLYHAGDHPRGDMSAAWKVMVLGVVLLLGAWCNSIVARRASP